MFFVDFLQKMSESCFMWNEKTLERGVLTKKIDTLQRILDRREQAVPEVPDDLADVPPAVEMPRTIQNPREAAHQYDIFFEWCSTVQ